MKTINIFLLGQVLTLLACKSQKKIEFPAALPSVTYDTVWTIPASYSIKPHLTKEGNVIYNGMFTADPNGESIFMVDGESGKKIFGWNNFLHSPSTISDNGVFFKDDKMVFCNGPRNYCINTINGSTIWRTQMLDHSASSSIYSDEIKYYYQAMSDANYRVDIYKSEIESGRKEIEFSIYDSAKTHKELLISPIVVSKNIKNEDILILYVYYRAAINDYPPKTKIFCYNLSKKKIDWVEDFDDKMNEVQVSNFATKDNKTFLSGFYQKTWYVFCLDNDNGKIIWQQVLPNFCVGLHIYEDQVIAMSAGQSPITSFNIINGNPKWTTSFFDEPYYDINFDFEDAIIFKNYLISTQGDYLLGLNIDNGKIICHKKMALPNSYMQYGIAINEEKRLFYVQDRFRILCYRLPKEIAY
jgi:outer membrane protein assembly factor BamB